MTLNIKSIGIVGGGPGGLSALYEFLHTNKDGTSSVGAEVRPADERSFDKIVVFEQKEKAGGVWLPFRPEIDPKVPPIKALKEDYSIPQNLKKLDQHDLTINDTYENPKIVETKKIGETLESIKWDKLATFESLFTNVPQNLTKFSYIKPNPVFEDKSRKLFPFLTLDEQIDRFQLFVEEEQLDEYIRYNSSVENIYKENGKWVVEVKKSTNGQVSWYRELFDALVLAWGHYSIPFFPKTPGFETFVEKYPDVLLHANSYRENTEFVDKDILVIGGAISAVNIVQHVYPVVKTLALSRRGPHPAFSWINVSLDDPRFDHKPAIKEYHENGEIEFLDGTRGKYDKIVLTTGYHYHFPHVEEYLQVVGPGNRSTVEGLFHNTFSIKDPTLGVSGVVTSPITFQPMEGSSAALAGVWSGAKQLPPQEEQQIWHDKLVLSNPIHNIVFVPEIATFLKEISVYWPEGRPDPLANDQNHEKDIEYGFHKLVKLFDIHVGLEK